MPDDRCAEFRNPVVIVQNRPADPLSDILSVLQTGAACSIRFQAGGAWSLRFRPEYVKFNVVRAGSCWLLTDDVIKHLSPGDCFMVTASPFVLAGDPALPPSDAASVFAGDPTKAQLGTSADVDILGGSVTLAEDQADLLLPLLPPVLVIARDGEDSSPIAWLVAQLDEEWRSGRPGSSAACDDIIRLLFVQALRLLFEEPQSVPSWLNGLSDPTVARALKAIHLEPERRWRLEELAAIAGQSRSTFAERFTRHVGVSPVNYATRWRLRLAAKALATTSAAISTIAAEAGYLSDSAFHAAFRREFAVSPASYRREHRRMVT